MPAGTITSTPTATDADAGTTAHGFFDSNVWVMAASASPRSAEQLLPVGTEDDCTPIRVTGSANTLSDDQLVLDVFHAVVTEDDLGVVDRVDHERRRAADRHGCLLCSLLVFPAAHGEGEGDDRGHPDDVALLHAGHAPPAR